MAHYRPFATSLVDVTLTYPGIQQFGNIVIGVDPLPYYDNYAGLEWIAGPDEDTGIIIAYYDNTVPYHSNQLNPSHQFNIGFIRLNDPSELISYVNNLGANVNDPEAAKIWLTSNGYWTSFNEVPWDFGFVDTSSTSGAWYFYSDEGPLNVGPPVNAGNAIILGNSGETFDPNTTTGSGIQIYFNTRDSNSVDYTAQFANMQANGGTIAITQNGQTATYYTTTPNAVQAIPDIPYTFYIIQTAQMVQTTSTDGPFTYNDPITLTFS